jgi:hypothetical protein
LTRYQHLRHALGLHCFHSYRAYTTRLTSARCPGDRGTYSIDGLEQRCCYCPAERDIAVDCDFGQMSDHARLMKEAQ